MNARALGGAALAAWLCAVAAQQSRELAAAGSPGGPALPARLADTGLYAGARVGEIDPRNAPFSPQYPLWSDGLTKSRWVYLPPGATIDARDEAAWRFPVGTKLWKEFRLNGRRIETRMLWKASGDNWIYGSYEWNADGTEAVLAAEDGVAGVVEVAPGRRHSIPSRGDCAACHGDPRTGGPLGFNALQLSTERDPLAIHGEALQPGDLTIAELMGSQRLVGARADLLSRPPRIAASRPSTRAVLGYLAANCGVCHNGKGEVSAAAPVLRLADLLADGDAVATQMIDAPTRWQLPGADHGSTVLLRPGAPDQSALLARMRSRSPSTQMPPLGTAVRDQAALEAITRWLNEDVRR